MKLRHLTLVSLLAIALAALACTVPAWVNAVEAEAEAAAPIAASLLEVIDPALAPLITLVENGFNALVKTLDTYKASPTATNLQAVQAAFGAVNSNVAQLESAAQIKSQATDAKVTAVVELLNQAVKGIASQVPGGTAAGLGARMKVQGQGQGPGLKAKDLKNQFNNIIKGDPRFAGKELK